KVVVRILDNRSINVPLENLGFSEDAMTIWKSQIDQPHGILLVTGPTGSGKTTTLYSSLRCMDGTQLNISTVEDPVEYNLPSANPILAQRLVRNLCHQCKEEYQPTPEMREFLTLQGFRAEAIFRGKGCDRCRKTGYAGRLGIYEMLVMDDHLRDMVTRNPDVNLLRKLCRERGLVSLREDGFQKVMKGLTTPDEILRVTENAM